MILVSAATGALGRLVVERLLDRVPSSEIAIVIRYPEKAADIVDRGVEVRRGDYDDKASLRAAFDHADRLLFISSPEVDAPVRIGQHGNVVEAARDAGVGLVVYTSGLGADTSDEGLLAAHHATERLLADSGVAFTALRNPIYTDVFITPALRGAVEAGELTGSTGDRGFNTALRADLAEAAAIVLTTPGHRQAYDFTGSRWTYPELAAALSEVSGRPVTYRDTDTDEGPMMFFGPAIRAGGFEVQTPDLERVLGRPPTGLRQVVAGVLGADATS